MAIASWSNGLATGVREVDDQHKELIKMINNLHEALAKGKGRDVASEAVSFLSDYVIEHFQMEEKLMVECNYPAYQAHKAQHEQFIKEFSDLAKEVNASTGASFLAIRVQRSILQWLMDHIMKVDAEMAKFVIAKTGGHVA